MRRRVAALTVASAALALGVAGGAVGAAQVTGAGIKDGSVTTKDIKDGTLKLGDLDNGVGGERGPMGLAGPPGAASEAGYSWMFRTGSPQVPAMATNYEITITCPAGTTVLGGGGYWDKPLDLLDSRQVVGQERWQLTLGNASGNTPVPVIAYAWCAGLTAPGFTGS